MAATIIVSILFVLCVLLLLPVRAKASFGDGKWSVSVYYAFIRVFHKQSAEPSPPPDIPPKPADLPAGEAPPEHLMPEPEPENPEHTVSDAVQQEEAAAESVSEPIPEAACFAEECEEKPDMPRKAKKKRKSRQEQEEESASEPEKQENKQKKRGFMERLKPHSLSDVLGLVQDGCAALSPALKFLTRHLHFRHVKLYAAIGSDDPANTAQLYGKICTAAFNLLAQLQCWVDMETEECRILADFFNDSITFRASLELRVSPMAAILLVCILGIKFLWRTVCRFRREDREAKRKAKETAPLPYVS